MVWSQRLRVCGIVWSAIFVVVLSSSRIYFVLTDVMQVSPFSGLIHNGKTNPHATDLFRNDSNRNVFADAFWVV